MNSTHAGWDDGATSRVLTADAGGSTFLPVTMPDGRAVLFDIAQDRIKQWDPAEGGEVAPAIFTAQSVQQAAAIVDRTGKPWIVLAFAGNGETFTSLHFLDAATGLESRAPLTGIEGTSFCALPLPDGRVILSVNRNFTGHSPTPDGDPSTFYHTTTQLWDADTHVAFGQTFTPASQHEVVPRGVVIVDGHAMLFDDTTPPKLWDLAKIEAGTWQPAFTFPFGNVVFRPAVLPLPDGRTVAIAGLNLSVPSGPSRVVAIDVKTGQASATPVELTDFVGSSLRLPLPGGGDLVAVVDDSGVRLFTPDTLTPVGPVLTTTDGTVGDLVAIPVPDGRVLLGAVAGGALRIWEPVQPPPTGTPLTGHDGPVLALAAVARPDGRVLLASGGRDRTVRLWDPETSAAASPPLTGHEGPVLAVAGAPGVLVSAGNDAMVRRWDPTTGAPIGAPLSGHIGAVRALAAVALADGRTLIISVGSDAVVRRWDAATGAPVGSPLAGHTGPIYAATAVTVGGAVLIATGGDDRTVRLWDPASGTAVGAPLTGHTGPVRALTTITVNNATLLASAGDDLTVRVWDPRTGLPSGAPLTGHTDVVRALAALPRHQGPTVLASAGDDGSLHLVNLTSPSPTGVPVVGPTDPARALAAVPAGADTLLAIAGDTGLTLWTIP